jgi:hypothetical protein
MNPMAILVVVTLTLTFEGLLFGADVQSLPFPEITANPASCQAPSGGIYNVPVIGNIVSGSDVLACWVGQTFLLLGQVVLMLLAVIAWFLSLATFNVPGAPLFVRFLMGTLIGGGMLWSVVSLFRGTKA